MLYVLDTSVFRVLGHYFPATFESLWVGLNQLVTEGSVTSTREVRRELEFQNTQDFIATFVQQNAAIFPTPTEQEMLFVQGVFAVPHFHQLMPRRIQLTGGPFADPWVIARAAAIKGCVISQESRKDHAARIPNICDHFGIPCLKVAEWMQELGWKF